MRPSLSLKPPEIVYPPADPQHPRMAKDVVAHTSPGATPKLELRHLQASGQVYLDYTGAALYPEVSPCPPDFFIKTMRTSWGFGIRWFSPLGPLRFEYGFPFKPLPYEESKVFEFTIGNFF